jgi:hypothetical protein
MQVALVGEAGGGFGDRLASFEQAAGFANGVGDLECVGWPSGPISKQADEAEFADPGCGGELVETDVALGPITEVVEGQAQGPVVAGSERRSGARTAEERAISVCSHSASGSSRSRRVVRVSSAV